MKHTLTYLFLFFTCMAFAQEVEVTLQVDMSGETVSPDGIHVAGDLNGWSTDATPLSDIGGGIYAVTVSLQVGRDIQYKFLNGNAWGLEEVPPPFCSVTGSNRVFTTPLGGMTLSPVPFGGCSTEGSSTKLVSFQADLSGETVSPDGVHVAGNFQGWSPGSTQMNDMGGGMYEVTVPVLNSIKVIQYKFINGNDWGMDEDPPAGCENFSNNRAVIADTDANITLPVQTFAGCDTPLPTKDVQFQVDMTGIDVSPNGVHLVGNLQAWSPGSTPMTDMGNGLYEVTLSIPASESAIQYKFMNGSEWGAEEDPPEDCADGENNRVAALPLTTDPVFLPGILYGTCDELVSLTELLDEESFTLFPSVADTWFTIQWELTKAESVTLQIIDLNGRILTEQQFQASDLPNTLQFDVSDWQSGMYLIYLRTQTGHSIRKLIVQ